MVEVTETRTQPDGEEPARRQPGLIGLFSEGGPVRLPKPRAVHGACILGREPSLDLFLDDAQVSRHHARIEPFERGVLVTDLGSRNGTYVDGVAIQTANAPAEFGSILRCGKTLLGVVDDVGPFLEPAPNDPDLVGSARLDELRRLVATIGLLPHSVLLLGETGTGKELVAHALHRASERSGPFVAVNCNAIASNLVESELFGHVRGAFSGSHRERPGLFRSAEGGTLFLDEIGDLPLPAQGKLLRALETGEVRAVGSDDSTVVQVRVVAATNVDLERMVQTQRFREDLLHRISVWKIILPPLRERREDIPLLVAHFLPEGSARFSAEAMERMLLHRWPGNVRELKNAVQTGAVRAAATGKSRVGVEHLTPEIAGARASARPAPDPDALLRTRIETALGLRNGNVAQVARDLGHGRQWLYSEMKRLGIDAKLHRRK
jgi:DNA-binding NtrC family response regulator